ncbi:hypothetical protein [Polaribacter sp.]|uniref:hypothetical protein n=1 Tax=Polaribacter sp. TaxID=1920175 RepID=UPI00404834A2
MRKLGFICLMFFAGSAFAQQNVTGPEAKNTNVWELKRTATVLNIKGVTTPQLKSPELKNLSIWQRATTSDVKVTIGNRKMHDLQGPKRKNFNPWQK